jgi:hypothetical protein
MAEREDSLEALPAARDAERAIPPRYWWLKRCAVGAGVMLLVVAISRWGWGAYASRMLEAEFERLRAAGEPIEPQDFDLPPVADELNVAIPLKEAVAIQQQIEAAEQQALANLTQEIRSNLAPGEATDRYTLRRRARKAAATRPEDANLAQARATGIARIRALVHEARLRREVNWGFITPNTWQSLLRVMSYEKIAVHLREAAKGAHQQGDDAAALDTLVDMLAMADHLSASRILLARLLAGIIFESVTLDLQQILAEPLSSAESKLPTGSRSLDRERANALITRLLDERVQREGMIWSMQRERLVQLNAIRLMTGDHAEQVTARSGPWEYGSFGLWLVRPMLQLDGVRLIRAGDRWVEAARTTHLPDVRQYGGKLPIRAEGLRAQSRVMSGILDPDFGNFQARALATLARRRMAATGLAIHLYAQDHGHMPETLDELVPQYLPTVPENPLLAAGHPIQYWLHCEYPCLYAPERLTAPADGKHLALVSYRFYLKGQPPEKSANRPTTKPVKAAG